jgi:hypothetical protein
LRIGDPAFFRIVDRLLGAGTSRTPRTQWSVDGVEWQRERHSYSGASHGFTIEVTTGVRAAASGWTLRVVKEYWRDGKGESTRDLQWALIEGGNRVEVVAWLKRQERSFE